jgi:hypothetical protein
MALLVYLFSPVKCSCYKISAGCGDRQCSEHGHGGSVNWQLQSWTLLFWAGLGWGLIR